MRKIGRYPTMIVALGCISLPGQALANAYIYRGDCVRADAILKTLDIQKLFKNDRYFATSKIELVANQSRVGAVRGNVATRQEFCEAVQYFDFRIESRNSPGTPDSSVTLRYTGDILFLTPDGASKCSRSRDGIVYMTEAPGHPDGRRNAGAPTASGTFTFAYDNAKGDDGLCTVKLAFSSTDWSSEGYSTNYGDASLISDGSESNFDKRTWSAFSLALSNGMLITEASSE